MGVFCEYLWENLPHYNDTALYVVITRSDIREVSKPYDYEYDYV